MKKIYLCLSVFLTALCPATAAAQPEGLSYGYCGDEITGVGASGASGPYWIAGAFQMTEADTEQFDGCDITGVSIGFGTGRNKEVTVFLTDDLSQPPFFEQKGRVRAGQWCDIDLTGAPGIEKGKPFYVGYRYNAQNSSAMPIGCDINTAGYTPTADLISLADTEEGLSENWNHYGPSNGNVCLRIFLKGDRLPESNCIPLELKLPDSATPGKEFRFGLSFTNASPKEVGEIEVEYQVGNDDMATTVYRFDTPVAPNGRGVAELTATTMQDDFSLPVTARITRVNGNDNANADRTVTSSFPCTNGLFMRKVVSEKLTGQHCGYCPRGIVAFDYVRETVGDRFIGIEVHNYDSNNLYVPDYENMLSHFGRAYSGAPSLTVNRNTELTTSADKSPLYNAFRQEYTEASQYGINVCFEESATAGCLDVTASVTSAYDASGLDYAVTFAVTEDHVKGQQYNNYNTNVGLPEWNGLGTIVNWYYDGVARSLHENWDGIPGSVPTDMKAGVPYKHTVTGFSLGKTSDKMMANVVAMLIDRKTGIIVNADMVHIDPARGYSYPEWDPSGSGVESVYNPLPFIVSARDGEISLRGEGVAEVYSVSGVYSGAVSSANSLRVAPGFYIISLGGRSQKLYVKP